MILHRCNACYQFFLKHVMETTDIFAPISTDTESFFHVLKNSQITSQQFEHLAEKMKSSQQTSAIDIEMTL